MRVQAGAVALAVVAAAMSAVVHGMASATAPAALHAVEKAPGATSVDVELVLAVDVSYSMDPDEQALQREGYITGLTSREFMQALRSGINGKVAATYFEWAGQHDQKIVVPWRVIDGPETADAFASEIARAPYRRASRTSISGALNFALPLFNDNGVRGLRRVIERLRRWRQQQRAAGHACARRCARRGCHHQRAADHAQTAEFFHHGYR